MTENLKNFLEAVSQNEEEKKKVFALTKEEVLAYAKDKGFTLTEEDLKLSREELSDDEIDAVAGGHSSPDFGPAEAAMFLLWYENR